MDINELCINCFKPTGGEEVCMHCGYIQADKPKQICHLYPHTILHNKYIIGRVINNGGFGVVYKAYDMHLDTVVAIKELLPTQNSMVTRMPPSANVIPVNDERNEAFKNYKLKFMEEARIMAQFSNCDSIVHIYDFFEENNTAYLVMEFLEGKTLREKLNENNDRIPYNEAINIMMPIMQALNLIHKSNIVHKDVSPDNIFICNDGRIKLIDFGAAKFGDNSAINDEAVVTKPGYTPPEQYRLNGEVGAYSDIYSVGAVLYTILSGRIPDESIDRIEHDNLAKLSKLGVDLPIYAEKSIMKALALKSSARFKSMDDFINAINGKKKADFPEVELKKKKILRAVIVAVALVIMILAVVIAFVVKSSNSLIPSKSTTITLWYVDNGDEDVNARWDKVTEDFEYFASKQKGELKDTKLVTVGVKSDEYDEKLKEAFDNGTAPDVYQSTSDEFEEYSYSLSEVYKEANSRVDNDYYNLMKDELKEHNQFAVCFDMPVLYTYTDSTKNKVPDVDSSLDDLKDTTLLDGFKYSLICNPNAILYTAYSYGYTDSEDSDIVKTLYDCSRNFSKDKYKSAQSIFTSKSDNAMYYIGFMSEYSSITGDIRLGGSSFDLSNLTGTDVSETYIYPEIWSISDSSSTVNKKTSELLLYFMLCTTDGQNDIVRVSNNTYYLPMLDDSISSLAYEDYELVYSSLNKKSTVQYDKIYSSIDKTNKITKSVKDKSQTFDDVKKILDE